jgi:hypothetical protein
MMGVAAFTHPTLLRCQRTRHARFHLVSGQYADSEASENRARPQTSGRFVGVLTHLFADAALGLFRQLSLKNAVSNKP